jgi:hypothetical protein
VRGARPVLIVARQSSLAFIRQLAFNELLDFSKLGI